MFRHQGDVRCGSSESASSLATTGPAMPIGILTRAASRICVVVPYRRSKRQRGACISASGFLWQEVTVPHLQLRHFEHVKTLTALFNHRPTLPLNPCRRALNRMSREIHPCTDQLTKFQIARLKCVPVIKSPCHTLCHTPAPTTHHHVLPTLSHRS